MKYFTCSALALCLIALTNIAHATVVVNYDDGVTNTVSSISQYNTSGSTMDGMQVTALFGDGSSSILSWADTGANSGGVIGSDWSLRFSGSTTFSSGWVLDYTGPSYIDSLFIDAGLGGTVFDTTSPYFGTSNSFRGASFAVTSGGAGVDIVATYSDTVALTGDAPVGDLYRNLALDFSSAGQSTGGFTGTLTFRADTDNVVGLMTSVPEPSSVLLFMLAIFGFVASRCRINK